MIWRMLLCYKLSKKPAAYITFALVLLWQWPHRHCLAMILPPLHFRLEIQNAAPRRPGCWWTSITSTCRTSTSQLSHAGRRSSGLPPPPFTPLQCRNSLWMHCGRVAWAGFILYKSWGQMQLLPARKWTYLGGKLGLLNEWLNVLTEFFLFDELVLCWTINYAASAIGYYNQLTHNDVILCMCIAHTCMGRLIIWLASLFYNQITEG